MAAAAPPPAAASRPQCGAVATSFAGQCPPRKCTGRAAGFCGALPAELGYTVHQAASESPRPGDCLLVTSIGFREELKRVWEIRNFTQSVLPRPRMSCKRLRVLVFCKAFHAPECNVTFNRNFGLECLAIVVVAGDSRFWPLIQDACVPAAQDAMISVPANTVADPQRRQRLRAILRATSARRLPPFLAFAQPGRVDEDFFVDQWKGILDRARPRPLGRWVLAHLPNASAELARKSRMFSEYTQGVFLASASAIRRHPPEAYLRLARTLDVVRPECCHYLERVWRYLFF